MFKKEVFVEQCVPLLLWLSEGNHIALTDLLRRRVALGEAVVLEEQQIGVGGRGRRRLHHRSVEAGGLRVQCKDQGALLEQGLGVRLGVGAHRGQRDDAALGENVPILLLLVNVVHLVGLASAVVVDHLGDDPVVVGVVAGSGEGGHQVADAGDVARLGRNGAAERWWALLDGAAWLEIEIGYEIG